MTSPLAAIVLIVALAMLYRLLGARGLLEVLGAITLVLLVVLALETILGLA